MVYTTSCVLLCLVQDQLNPASTWSFQFTYNIPECLTVEKRQCLIMLTTLSILSPFISPSAFFHLFNQKKKQNYPVSLIFWAISPGLTHCASTLKLLTTLTFTFYQWPHHDTPPPPSMVRRKLFHSITGNEVRVKALSLPCTVK